MKEGGVAGVGGRAVVFTLFLRFVGRMYIGGMSVVYVLYTIVGPTARSTPVGKNKKSGSRIRLMTSGLGVSITQPR